MKSKVIFVTFVVLAGILMGCSAETGNPLIEYQRSGGIAGFDDRLVIDSTGNATLTRKDQELSFTLSADEISALENALEAANFTRLDEEYLPENPGADLFEYRLTFAGHTVRMVDTVVPEGMQPILDTLNQLIEANG